MTALTDAKSGDIIADTWPCPSWCDQRDVMYHEFNGLKR